MLNRTYQRDWEATKRDPEYIKQFNKDVRLSAATTAAHGLVRAIVA